MSDRDQARREEAKRALDVLDAAEPVRGPGDDVLDDEAGIETDPSERHTPDGDRS